MDPRRDARTGTRALEPRRLPYLLLFSPPFSNLLTSSPRRALPSQVLKLWDHFQNLPNTDTSGLPDVPDLSTFNPRTLELTELSMIKMTDKKAVLHGCGAFKLLDKLNAKALIPDGEFAIMKEEGVFGPDTSAYTFDPVHLDPNIVAEVAHEYGFKVTEYEGVEA